MDKYLGNEINNQKAEFGPTYKMMVDFMDASNLDDKERVDFENFIKSFPKINRGTDEENIEMVWKEVANKVTYDIDSYDARGLFNGKGNCLSLTILYGIIFSINNLDPKYILSVHPDIFLKSEDFLFDRYMRENYQNPSLPKISKQAEEFGGDFTPLEHPFIRMGDINFEVTNFDGAVYGKDENFYKTESRQEINNKQLVNFVRVDSIRHKMIEINSSSTEDKKEKFKVLMIKMIKVLEINPKDRECWATLYELAYFSEDDDIKDKAKEEFVKIGGDDSRYYFSLYKMTNEDKYLNLALEKYPYFIEAFIEKRVFKEKDSKEAKANLSVAMKCVASSSALTLRGFYGEPAIKTKIIELWGEEYFNSLTK